MKHINSQTSIATVFTEEETTATGSMCTMVEADEHAFPFFFEHDDNNPNEQSIVPFEIFQSSASSISCTSDLHDSCTSGSAFCLQFVAEPMVHKETTARLSPNKPSKQEGEQQSDKLKSPRRRSGRQIMPRGEGRRGGGDRHPPPPPSSRIDLAMLQSARRARSHGSSKSGTTTGNGGRSSSPRSPLRRNLTTEFTFESNKRPLKRTNTSPEEGDDVGEDDDMMRPRSKRNTGHQPTSSKENTTSARRVPRSERRRNSGDALAISDNTTHRQRFSPIRARNTATTTRATMDDSMGSASHASTTRVRIQRSEMRRSGNHHHGSGGRARLVPSNGSNNNNNNDLDSSSSSSATQRRKDRHVHRSKQGSRLNGHITQGTDVLRTQLSQTVHNNTAINIAEEQQRSKELITMNGPFSPEENEKHVAAGRHATRNPAAAAAATATQQQQQHDLTTNNTDHIKAASLVVPGTMALKGMVKAAKNTTKSLRSTLHL